MHQLGLEVQGKSEFKEKIEHQEENYHQGFPARIKGGSIQFGGGCQQSRPQAYLASTFASVAKDAPTMVEDGKYPHAKGNGGSQGCKR